MSLIIATTARADRIAPLCDRARRVVAACGDDCEVLIVDNSPDGRLARDRWGRGTRIVRSTLPGLSRARTTGCIHARGEVIVFTDDDVEFDATWPMRMADPILAGRCTATAAPVRLGPEFDDVTTRLQREWLAEANLSETSPTRLVGAGMGLHRDALGFGLWDPRLGAGVLDTPFGEETLFEAMMRAAGATVEVVRDAEVVHHPDPSRTTPAHWRRTAWAKGRSEAYIAYHWYGEALRLPWLRALRRRLRLLMHHRRGVSRGAFVEELRLIQSIGFADGFARMRREPRAYAAQPGGPARAEGIRHA